METTSDLPRTDERTLAVRRRDRDQCQACKRTTAETAGFHIHQIVPGDQAANQLSNYVLLCPQCHCDAHRGADEQAESSQQEVK